MNLILECLVHCLLAKSVFAYEKLIFNTATNATDHIFFLFFHGPTINDYKKIPYNDALSMAEDSAFDVNKDTVFYLHGWSEKPSEHEESTDTIASAFLTRNIVNLVILDYSGLVKGGVLFNYLRSVYNITDIGYAFGHFLKCHIPKIQSVEQVHIIGHSLGSQIMSRAAYAYGKGELYWLTALDPSGPWFNIPAVDHLTKEDGQFVDVIHTDAGKFGDERSVGHVDFYPNMGTSVQPYCSYLHSLNVFCSHHMSWRFYAESVLNETIFPAKQCDLNLFCNPFTMSWFCEKDASVTYMGYGVNTTARGNFYLKTSANEPFGLGEAGFYV